MNRKERRAKERSAGRPTGTPAPADAEGLFRAGFAHQRAGRPAEALALYQRVLAIRPDEPEVLHWAGVAAYEQNQFEMAAELIGRAVARAPGRPEFHKNLGNALKSSRGRRKRRRHSARRCGWPRVMPRRITISAT